MDELNPEVKKEVYVNKLLLLLQKKYQKSAITLSNYLIANQPEDENIQQQQTQLCTLLSTDKIELTDHKIVEESDGLEEVEEENEDDEEAEEEGSESVPEDEEEDDEGQNLSGLFADEAEHKYDSTMNKKLDKCSKRKKDSKMTKWHGQLQETNWTQPQIICESYQAHRGSADDQANEYRDSNVCLKQKVALLAQLILQSKSTLCQTGAGISTAAGIGDYASKDNSTVTNNQSRDASSHTASLAAQQQGKQQMTTPTRAHAVLAAMETKNLVHQWVQQNHDGLPQKAGFPQIKMNEVHGSWFDPSNPVFLMDGQLRGDLAEGMEWWAHNCQLCLCLGTSLSGMYADQCATQPMKSFARGKGLGTVIISIQKTQQDSKSSLRIFATLDKVFDLLAKCLNISLPKNILVKKNLKHEEQEHTQLLKDGSVLDLRKGSKLVITDGSQKGDIGRVIGVDTHNNYEIQFRHKVGGVLKRRFGHWWIYEGMIYSEIAVKFPIRNIV